MAGAAKMIRNQSWLRCTLQSILPLNSPPIFQLISFSAPLAILRRPWPQRLSQRYVAPTLWRNAHTIPVHCLIHGSACAGCWDCTGQVVGKVCTIPGTAPPPTWHPPAMPASPPCSRPSDPAATADESGPRSAPDPSQPVENFPLHPDGWQWWALVPGARWWAIKVTILSSSAVSGKKKVGDEVNGVSVTRRRAYSAFHTLAARVWQNSKSISDHLVVIILVCFGSIISEISPKKLGHFAKNWVIAAKGKIPSEIRLLFWNTLVAAGCCKKENSTLNFQTKLESVYKNDSWTCDLCYF